MSLNLNSASLTKLVYRKVKVLRDDVENRFAKIAWQANAILCQGIGWVSGSVSKDSRSFNDMPIFQGILSQERLSELRRVILDAPEMQFDPTDHARGYTYNPDSNAQTRLFSGGYRFRHLDVLQCQVVSSAIAELASEITRRIGSGWCLINLKSWSTRIDTVQAGPNAWHRDGFPTGTYKLMIYLTPIGPALGTTEIRFANGSSMTLEGEAGTFLLFDPSELWHRGIAPTQPNVERTLIEVSLMRSPVTDPVLVFAGINSAYPRFPWTRRPILSK